MNSFLLDEDPLDVNNGLFRGKEDSDLVNLASLTPSKKNHYDFFEYQGNENLDHFESRTWEEDEQEVEEEQSVTMPEEYYNELENFLNRPPPKIGADGKTKKGVPNSSKLFTQATTSNAAPSRQSKVTSSGYAQAKKKTSSSGLGGQLMNDDLLRGFYCRFFHFE